MFLFASWDIELNSRCRSHEALVATQQQVTSCYGASWDRAQRFYSQTSSPQQSVFVVSLFRCAFTKKNRMSGTRVPFTEFNVFGIHRAQRFRKQHLAAVSMPRAGFANRTLGSYPSLKICLRCKHF
jgi:hypothetical protein